MPNTQMEELIEQMEIYIDSCPGGGMFAGSGTIKVNREELLEMLEELRKTLPVELRESQRILKTRDAILADAKAQATQIMNRAKEEAASLVNGDEVVALANRRSDDILKDAKKDADELKAAAKNNARAVQRGALEYTQEMLEGLQGMYESILKEEKAYFEEILSKLNEEYKKIVTDKKEIDMQLGNGMRTSRRKEDFERKAEPQE